MTNDSMPPDGCFDCWAAGKYTPALEGDVGCSEHTTMTDEQRLEGIRRSKEDAHQRTYR